MSSDVAWERLTLQRAGIRLIDCDHRTACGATLIATQFTDAVEYGGGGGSAARQANSAPEAAAPATLPAALAAASGMATAAPPVPGEPHADHKYDLAFRVQDESTGKALAHTRNRITLDDGTELFGTTDAGGMTEKVCSPPHRTRR